RARGQGQRHRSGLRRHARHRALHDSWRRPRQAPAQALPREPMTSPDARRRMSLLARWAVAALAMAFVVRELFSDPEPLRRLFGTLPQVLRAVGARIAGNQLLMSFRFSLAVQLYSGKHVPSTVWFRLISVGQMLNLFVPQLGSVYRGVALKREFGIAYMTYAA